MEKLYVFCVLAILTNQALGMNLRQKRQSDDNEEDLEDRYGWNWPAQRPLVPDQDPFNWQNQFPGQDQFGQGQFPDQEQQPLSTTTPTPIGTTTLSAAVQTCIRNCPVTPEYNPVCGSDTQTYNNPGRLICAQICGVRVTQVRSAPCPTVTPASTN